MLRRPLLLPLLLFPLVPRAAVAADRATPVDGSGTRIDQSRELPPFRRLTVDGPIDLTLKAAATERAVVHADDNLAPLVETRVSGDTLAIGARAGSVFRTRSRLKVTVEFRQLESLRVLGSGNVHADHLLGPIMEVTIRGSGDVSIDDLQAEALAASISGSGDFTAAGRADKLGVVLTGAGDLRAEKLEAREAAIRIRGSGDARVHATATLAVDISGSGDVRYRGEPAISRRIKGSGTVAPLR
jgi:hypothetical protein